VLNAYICKHNLKYIRVINHYFSSTALVFFSLFCQSFFSPFDMLPIKMFSMNKLLGKNSFYLFLGYGRKFLPLFARALCDSFTMQSCLHRDTPKIGIVHTHTGNLFTMMWKTKNIYNEILFIQIKPEDPIFQKDIPLIGIKFDNLA